MKKYVLLSIFIVLFVYLGLQYLQKNSENSAKNGDNSQVELLGKLVVKMDITSRDSGGGKAEQAAFITCNEKNYRLNFDKNSKFVNVDSISIFESGNEMKVKGIWNGDSIMVRYMEYLN